MKRHAVAAIVMAAVVCQAAAQQSTGDVLANLAQRMADALVTVRIDYEDETGARSIIGIGTCIDESGVFMTLAIDERSPLNAIKKIELIRPGKPSESFEGKLLGVDAATNLGFVRAEGSHKWTAVQFSRSADLSVGQQVYSAGILVGRGTAPLCVASGYISAILRAPEKLAYVSGGKLTGVGSPVFSADGLAIGLVGRQMYMTYIMTTAQGSSTAGLEGRQEASFFTPVDEFVYVLENIPQDGKVRRLPWLGVGKFDEVQPEYAELIGLNQPGIMVDQVVPGHPADRAGMKNRDIIIAMNGEPIEDLGTPDLTAQQFARKLAKLKIGQTIELTVMRGSQKLQLRPTLAATPQLPSEANRYYLRALGILVRDKVALDRFIEKSQASEQSGVWVLRIARGSPAEAAGLQSRDMICRVNGQSVGSVDQFRQVMENTLIANPSAPVTFEIYRGNQPQQITVRPPTR